MRLCGQGLNGGFKRNGIEGRNGYEAFPAC